MTPYGPSPQCPDCSTPLPRGIPHCHACGLPLTGPVATRLGQVVAWIQRVEYDRAALYAQRDGLIRELRAQRDAMLTAQLRAAAPPTAPSGPAQTGLPHPPADPPQRAAPPAVAAASAARTPAPRPRREISARSVQNVLLGLGGLLVVAAALVFTIVTWSDLGVGVRSLVLGAATALTGYAARPLHRRGMGATAETVGVLAAALVCLDGAALWLAADPPVPPTGYAAGVLAVVCALLACYPRLVPLRGPRVLALLLLQPIPVLAGLATPWGAGCVPIALAVTALGGTALLRVPGVGPVRLVRALAATAWAASVAASACLLLAAVALPALLDASGVWAAAGLAAAGAVALLDSRAPVSVASATLSSGGAALAWLLVPPAAASAAGAALPWVLAAFAAGAAAAAFAVRRGGALRVVVAALAIAGAAGAGAALPLLGMLAQPARPWQGRFVLVELPDPWVLGLSLCLAASGAGASVLAATLRREYAAAVAVAAAALVGAVSGQPLGHAATVGALTAIAVALMAAAVAVRPHGADAADGWRGAAARSRAARTALSLSLLSGTVAICGALAAPRLAVVTAGALTAAAVAGAALSVPLRSLPAARMAYSAAAVLLAAGAATAWGVVWSAPAATVVAALLGTGLAAAGAATALDHWGGPRDQVAALDAALAVPLLAAVAQAAKAGAGATGAAAAVSVFALLAVVRHRRSLPTTARLLASAAAGLALTATAMLSAPLLAQALAGPLLPASAPWQDAAGVLVPGQPSPALTAAAILALAAAAAWTLLAERTAAGAAALVWVAATAALVGAAWLPGALLPSALTVVAAVLLGVCVLAERFRERGRSEGGRTGGRPALGPVRAAVAGTALALSGVVAVLAAAASLTGPGTTVAVLGALTACAGAAAVVTVSPPARAGAAAAGVLLLSGLAAAALAAAGAPPVAAALAMAVVAATAVGCATASTRLGGRTAQAAALDAAAAVPMVAAAAWAASVGRDPVALIAALGALLALVAATHTASRSTARRALTALSALLGAGTLLLVGDRVLATLLSPFLVAQHAWLPSAARWQTLPLAFSSPTDRPGLLLAACAVALTALALCAGLGWGRGSVLSAAAAGSGLLVPLALTHLPVRYSAALGIAVAVAGALLLLAARGSGRGAHLPLWSGVFVAAMAAGWALATPLRTVLVLAALGAAALTAMVCATPGLRASAPAVSRVLALTAGLAPALAVFAGYAALPFFGIAAEPRWLPFTGLAAAGVLALAAQVWAGASGLWSVGRLRVVLAPSAAAAQEWAARLGATQPFPDRPEQRGGLVGASLAMVLAASLATAAAPESLGLVAALAALLLFALAAALPRGFGWTVTGVGCLALLAAVATVAGRLGEVLFAPYAWVGAAWHGTGPAGLAAPAPSALAPWGGPPADPLLLPVVTASALAVLVAVRTRAAGALAPTAAVLAPPALVPYAVATGAVYGVALGWVLLVTTALAGVAALVRTPRLSAAAGAAALWPASLAVAWGLAEPAATLVVLGLLAVVAAVCLAVAAPQGRAAGSPAFSCGAAVVAVLSSGGFALALPLASGQPARVAALAVLVVVAGVVLVPYLARVDAPILAAAECAAGVLGAASVLLTLGGEGRLELTSAALACLGVIAAAGAARPGRGWLGAVGGVLLLASGWVFLAWLRVSAPEPYTVVPALAALAAGASLRQRRPGTSTWLAYGPGLVLLLGPGLVLVLAVEAHPWRVAALGAAAVAATLAGARWRLQAPLSVGAVVVLLTAATAFGPPVWNAVLALPNWIPVGAVGLLLLVIGARYERRLRDVRRLGRALREME